MRTILSALTVLVATTLTSAEYTARDSAVLATSFPFETTLCYTCERDPDNFGYALIEIERYQDTLVFMHPVEPALIGAVSYADFALERLPLFSGAPFLVRRMASYPESLTVAQSATEYVVPIDSLVLYMRVLEGDSTTLSVRFDTARSVPLWHPEAMPANERIPTKQGADHMFHGLQYGFLMPDTTDACPRTVMGEMNLHYALYQPATLQLSRWPSCTSSWAPGWLTIEPEKLPPDSTAPLITRHIGSNCQDSLVEIHNEGVEYRFPISRVADLWMRVADIDVDSMTLEFDTASALASAPVLPSGRSARCGVMSGASVIVDREPAGLVITPVAGERSPRVAMLLDLAGRPVERVGFPPDGRAAVVSTRGVPRGTYVLVVVDRGGMVVLSRAVTVLR